MNWRGYGETEKMVIKVKLDKGAYMPTREFRTDAGADLRTPKRFILRAGDRVTIDTGVHIQVPEGYMVEVRSKSGLMTKSGITTDGTVDCGYTGSIAVCLFNHSKMHRVFEKGDKIAQMTFTKIETPAFEQVDEIESGDRGDRGFGSTGR